MIEVARRILTALVDLVPGEAANPPELVTYSVGERLNLLPGKEVFS